MRCNLFNHFLRQPGANNTVSASSLFLAGSKKVRDRCLFYFQEIAISAASVTYCCFLFFLFFNLLQSISTSRDGPSGGVRAAAAQG